MEMNNELSERQPGTTRGTPLGIGAFGLNERSCVALEAALETAAKGAYKFVDEGKAEAGVIDIDIPGGQALLAGVRQRRPDLALVVFSANDVPATALDANMLFLRKPVRLARLLIVLDEIAQSLVPATSGGVRRVSMEVLRALENSLPAGQRAAIVGHRAGAREDLGLDDPERRKQWFFSEEESICGFILHVAKACVVDQIPRRIAYMGQWISILPKLGLVDGDLTAAQLKQFGFMRFQESGKSSFEVTELSFEAQSEPRRKTVLAAGHGVALDVFMWKVAAAASRGRAPEGTDPKALMAMRHWPNMTRLQPLPNGLRIAALWDAGPRSLCDVAEMLGIRFANVLTFYAAAAAIGLMVPARRQLDGLLEPTLHQAPGQGSLFERIRARLGDSD